MVTLVSRNQILVETSGQDIFFRTVLVHLFVKKQSTHVSHIIYINGPGELLLLPLQEIIIFVTIFNGVDLLIF